MKSEKILYLESLGIHIEQIIGKNSPSAFFEFNGYSYEIDLEDFCIGDSLNSIISQSEQYSPCCGEPLDSDWMICLSCKEHC